MQSASSCCVSLRLLTTREHRCLFVILKRSQLTVDWNRRLSGLHTSPEKPNILGAETSDDFDGGVHELTAIVSGVADHRGTSRQTL